ncbi:MAG TPA: monovalent cation/H(+) antiporter subunit G [Actinomycetota bacterium]|nr:monovalent cation/H(+) antiporter subunit G [Actinomycetota bacterium]
MTVIISIAILLGSALMVLAAVGVVRLPDVYARLQAGTKAASLGLALIFLGTALASDGRTGAVKLVLAALFQFATAPVAAHVIGRAAYLSGAPQWEGTVVDELADAFRTDAGRADADGGPDEGPPSAAGRA